MFRFNHMTRGSCAWCYASAVIVAVSVAVAAFVLPISAQEVKQKAFGSPEEAMKTLAETVQAGDTKGMMAILGPEGEDIISSGDEVADKNALEQFVKAYQEKVDFVKEKEDRVSIIIGNDYWPFPIPIVKKGEGWVFDTKAGQGGGVEPEARPKRAQCHPGLFGLRGGPAGVCEHGPGARRDHPVCPEGLE